MSSLNSLYIKKETLETLLKVVNKKGEKGVELTVSINDEANDYDQNVSAWVSQSKEHREAKKPRFFTGNGRTFWTNGVIQVPKKKDEGEVHDAQVVDDSDEDDLPF